MTRVSLILTTVIVLCSSALADDGTQKTKAPNKLRVNIACDFRYTNPATADCATFTADFIAAQQSQIDYVESSSQADLLLNVTDQPAIGNLLPYVFTWTSQLPNTSRDPISLPLELQINADSTSTEQALVANASKGLFLYYTPTTETTNPATGGATVTFTPPNGGGGSAPTPPSWIDKMANSAWFFNVGINGSGSSMGIAAYNTTSKSLTVTNEDTYFSQDGKVKIDFQGAFGYQSASEPSGTGTQISASDTQKAAAVYAIYSFSPHFDVAVINATNINPGANIALQSSTAIGVEWALVPFRTTQNKELDFRIAPGFTTSTLEQPNYLNHMGERLMGAMAQIYFYWAVLGDKLIFSANGSATEGFKYADDWNMTATTSATYQLNRALGFNSTFTYTYDPTSLTFPGNPNYSNPLMTQFLTGQPGNGYNLTFGMTLNLGNVVKHNADRRWNTH